jgi:YbbR domain-containing protein
MRLRLRQLFLHNLPAKLLSLFFAIVLWTVVIGERKAQMQLNVPLALVNIPEQTVVVSDVPGNISVTVQGPRTLLRSLPGRDIRKNVDLKDMGKGWTTVRILPDSIPMPRGVEVIRVTPSSLDIKLERAVEKAVPVVPQMTGEPPGGYRIKDIVVEPLKVTLRGGERELGGIGSVKTNAVSLEKGPADLEERVGLELEGLHPSEVSPPTVTVRVDFEPIIVEKSWKDIKVKPPAVVAQRVKLVPEKVEVVLQGPMVVLEGLKGEEIKASIELKDMEPGVYRLKPAFSIPKDVRLLKVVPDEIEVTVEPEAQKNQGGTRHS